MVGAMAEDWVARGLVLVARGLALIPSDNLAARCEPALRCQFARAPSFSVPVSALWSEQVPLAEAGQWGRCRGIGSGTAAPRPLGEREPVRAVSPASCAATDLELEPPMAIAPAAGGGGGGGGLLLDLAGTSKTVPPRFLDRFCKVLLSPAPLLCMCLPAFPRVMPRYCR